MGLSWSNCCWRFRIASFVAMCAVYATSCDFAKAQITPDQSLGTENSTITDDTIKGIPSERIDGGAIRGANLFHSFTQFNIREGTAAYFTNPTGIENILTRVSGNNVSNILGTLGVLGNANLFLMNPHGIVFGKNARLDIGGSFFATTANSLVLKNGWEFSATNPFAPPLLKINVPLGLQSESNPVGDIANAGKLAVNPGESLTLWGSTVTSTGSLIAPGGTVQLLGERVGLFDRAQIDVSGNTGSGTVLIGGDFQGRGTIPTAKRTYIGSKVIINADALNTGNGGNVIIWADEVTGFYGNITARGGSISGNGGFVEVSAKENLIFRGKVDTSAINGFLGTLLLDPTNIIIANGSGDETGDRTDTFAGNNSRIAGSILSAPLSNINDTAPTTIYESELESLSGDINIILQATNDITVNPLSDRGLTLADGSGKITFTADADRDGIGNFQMDTADTITTNGRDISISGASLTLGNIDTTSLVKGGDIIAVADVDAGGAIIYHQNYEPTSFTFTVLESQPIEDLNVQFAAALSNFDDLVVGLTSPSGTKLSLLYLSKELSTVGGDGYNFQDTLLDDSAATSIDIASFPFKGRFKPNGLGGLASFKGENPTGTWQLQLYEFGLPADVHLGTLYKAGETAPWGIANGTKLIFRSPDIPLGNSGAITLNATRGNINIGNIHAENLATGGEVNLSATDNINLNGSLAAVNNIKILADVDANGIGNVQMNTANTIKTNGQNVEIKGVNLTLGNIDTSDKLGGGNITLTATKGNISTQYLNSSSYSASGNTGSGGAIALTTTQGDISTQGLYSSSSSDTGNAGSGGAISLTTTGGHISTQNLDSSSFSGSGNTGSGGAITLATTEGNISTPDLNSSSFSLNSGNTGSGGAINLTTTQGNISIPGLLSSKSFSYSGNTGSGGAISLNTIQGNISTQKLDSSSSSISGNTGSGGTISLTTTQGNISTLDLNSSSYSASGNTGSGGAISLTTTQGNINISTQLLMTPQLYNSGSVSAFSTSGLGNAGSGGTISLTTTQGNISTPSLYSSSFSNSGNAGSGGTISLSTTQGNISTQKLDSSSFSNSRNAGSGGAIYLTNTGGNISTQDLYSFSYSGSGNAGSGGIITLSAIDGNIDGNIYTYRDRYGNIIYPTFNSFSVSTNGNSGEGGNVTLAAKNQIRNLDILTLSSASKSGDVEVKGFSDLSVINTNIITSKQVTIQNPININQNINLDLGGVGQSGNVNITSTGSLKFKDSHIESDTRESNPAGNVNITSPGTIIFNNSQVASNTSSTGKAGNIQINANRLTLTDASEISASTASSGQGGSLTVNASLFALLQNQSRLLTQASGSGTAGNVTINTPQLNLQSGAKISANTISSLGGDIQLQGLNTLEVNNSEISASTHTGKAGNLRVNAADSVELNAGSLSVEATGKDSIAGELRVNTGQFYLTNGAQVTVSSPQGQAGNVDITANSLFLNQGRITAETGNSGAESGANINLQISDWLQLQNESLISATALDQANGGNINIDTLFLTAFPSTGSKGSDIIANAERGNGGRIGINAQGIFGIEFREQQTPLNDFTVSSEFGNSGQVEINRTVDPSRGLIELPTEIIDVSELIAQDFCRVVGKSSEFVVTGRGGLPTSPNETLRANAPWEDLRLVEQSQTAVFKLPAAVRSEHPKMKDNQPETIVEAQGWIIAPNGNMLLTAKPVTVTPYGLWLHPLDCQQWKQTSAD